VGVIRLRRLGSKAECFYLNPDLILAVEATPDTVVTLTTHTKVLVADSPEDVVAAVRAWRSSVIAAALPPVKRRSDVPLTVVRATAGEPPVFEPKEPRR
jgi:flagellar protein FlbD